MSTPSINNGLSVLSGECYRITVLTDQLIRLEYAEDGLFEDRPTQFAQNRTFDTVHFHYWKTQNGIELHTKCINLFYNERMFSSAGLWAENRTVCGGIYSTWHYGDPKHENLGGTIRTLDEVDGEIETDAGILSRLCGYSVIDDSHSPVLTEDGWYEPARKNHIDIYLFFYGYHYKQALRDYFHLSGYTPLLPRFVFGNWWSRYHAYSDTEYLSLMDHFFERSIPISVAVIDMDWHITDAGPEGKGWTGYTWNKYLFPDPEAFLNQLHKRNLKTTLNLHPAEGIQVHEDKYQVVAEKLEKDIENHQRVFFDISSREFMDIYLSDVHQPLENMGVDFWWIDWQQGKVTTVDQVDPQWVLNHYHTKHAEKNNKRAVILSRYCGPGSHRYPIGFSGDSVISWSSLNFQPKFTSMASNIGYGWWSHDIGGHTHGKRDNELQTRWLQYGVFSPILRLHSTSNNFNGKEPWRYPEPYCSIMTRYLQLRYRFIPYVYTMNWLCHTQGEMLIQPMYYAYPDQDVAYCVPNQYFFGSQLIVMPITEPQNTELQLGSTTGWLPNGVYYDIFTGVRYTGNRMLKVFRTIDNIPVFAKAGSIVILSHKDIIGNSVTNPQALEINIFAGDNGTFDLYEDDSETKAYTNGEYNISTYTFTHDSNECCLRISTGSKKDYLPEKRDYCLRFFGVPDNQSITVSVDGSDFDYKTCYHTDKNIFEINLSGVPQGAEVSVVFAKLFCIPDNHVLDYQEAILNYAYIEYELKDQVFKVLSSNKQTIQMVSDLTTLNLPNGLLEALLEPIC